MFRFNSKTTEPIFINFVVVVKLIDPEISTTSLNEYSHYMYTIIGICYSSKFVSFKIDFVKDCIFEEMRVDIVTTTHTFFPYKRSSEIKIAMINFE